MSKQKLIIEAGKYYRTRDCQKVYCRSVNLPSPKGFHKFTSKYIVDILTIDGAYMITAKGMYSIYENSPEDIISEWTEPVETRTFKSPKQLAKALLKGQKWKLSIDKNYCYWDTKYNKYCLNGETMDQVWGYADGLAIWTRVKD